MEGDCLEAQVVESDDEEEEDEEELDNALEREFQRAQSPSTHPGSPSLSLPLLHHSSQPSSLTFSFPGWGVQIFRDRKRCKPSIIRQISLEDTQIQEEEKEHPHALALGFADDPGNGHSIYQMPHEIVINIFKRLPLRDVCSVMRTCHWWQHIGSQDEIWQRFHLSNETSVPLPRWAIVKHDNMSIQVQNRDVSNCGYFCKGFSHLRSALRSWWDTETLKEPYSSKSIGGLLHKMSMHNWTTVYEFLGIVFSERADFLASLLLNEVKKQAKKHAQSICPFDCDHQSKINEDEELSSTPSLVDLSKELPSSFSLYDRDQVSLESLIGRNLWVTVSWLWKRYKQWLMLIFEHCPRLNFQVMVEKARTTAWTTPSIYEKGVICFRSQVLLKYGLRRILQSGYSWLASSDADGLTSDSEVDLLQSIYHLLQEVDVRDDTLSSQAVTQTKLWRCFPVKRSSDGQARRTLNKRNKKLISLPRQQRITCNNKTKDTFGDSCTHKTLNCHATKR